MSKGSKVDHPTSDVQDAASLFETQQYWLCQQLAKGKPPWSQRAQALLAINEGASEEAAGELSQLRTTQVKFWLNKFNRVGMDMFPEELLNEVNDNSAISRDTPTGEVLPSDNETGKAKKLKKTKKAQKKNRKGKNKKTKAKKGKSSKKSMKAERAKNKPKKKKK